MAKRVQRKRTRGWRMPSNAKYVGRPSKWGNPFRVGIDGDIKEVLEKYAVYLDGILQMTPSFLDPLKGKDLACWCPLGKPCHADILLKFLEAEPL